MIMFFCKSLDRPVNIFGLRGAWIVVYLAMFAVSVVLGLVTGFAMGTGLGISVFISGVVLAFLFVYGWSMKVHHRDLSKLSMTSSCKTYVRRNETLSRIILRKSDNPSWFGKNHKNL